jgi:hypothetical protein
MLSTAASGSLTTAMVCLSSPAGCHETENETAPIAMAAWTEPPKVAISVPEISGPTQAIKRGALNTNLAPVAQLRGYEQRPRHDWGDRIILRAGPPQSQNVSPLRNTSTA